MGLRFRKSIKIAPGVKVNFNKKSVGVSVGTKGAHVTVNSKGRKTTTVGIPGSGLSYTKSKQIGSSASSRGTSDTTATKKKPVSQTAACENANSSLPSQGNSKFPVSRFLFCVLMVFCCVIAVAGIAICFDSGFNLEDISLSFLFVGLAGLSYCGTLRAKEKTIASNVSSTKSKRIKKISIALAISSFLVFMIAPSSTIPVEEVKLQIAERTMDINTEQDIYFTVYPKEASNENLSFESSDPDVVSISGDAVSGKIKSHAEGEAYVYIESEGKRVSKKIKIIVVDKEAIKKAEQEAAKKAEAEKQAKIEKEKQEKERQDKASTQATYVYIPQSGSKYHRNSSCSNMSSPSKVTLDEAKQMGYEPCKRCY